MAPPQDHPHISTTSTVQATQLQGWGDMWRRAAAFIVLLDCNINLGSAAARHHSGKRSMGTFRLRLSPYNYIASGLKRKGNVHTI